MKNLVLFLFGLLLFQPVYAQKEELPQEYHTAVQHFIDGVKKRDAVALSGLVYYPLKRAYPIPSIKDSVEFIVRFTEIFDDSLIAMITSSDVKTDWSQMGWRGIMFNHGSVWLDDEGKLEAVNYQSAVEAAKEMELIEKDRSSLYPALQDYERPDIILETKKFRVRIDEMTDGTYRYASWGINKLMSEEPDLILKKGEVVMDGSGGNHHYEFVSGDFKYICWINVLGSEETSPANLEVLKKNKRIVWQSGTIVNP